MTQRLRPPPAQLNERQRDILAGLATGQTLRPVALSSGANNPYRRALQRWLLEPVGWWAEDDDVQVLRRQALIEWSAAPPYVFVLTERGWAESWAWPNPVWPARPFPPWWPLWACQAMGVFTMAEQAGLFHQMTGGLGYWQPDALRYETDDVKVSVMAFFEEAIAREQAGLDPFPAQLCLPFPKIGT